jgi:hypothetical protein
MMKLPTVENHLLKYNVDPVIGLIALLPSLSKSQQATVLMALLPYYHPKPKGEIGGERAPEAPSPAKEKSVDELVSALHVNGNGTHPRPNS